MRHHCHARTFLFFPCGQLGPRSPDCWGFKITHNGTVKSVPLPWTTDRLVAETSTRNNIQNSQETNIHVPGEIRTRNPSKQATTCQRFRQCGHRNRLVRTSYYISQALLCASEVCILCPLRTRYTRTVKYINIISQLNDCQGLNLLVLTKTHIYYMQNEVLFQYY